jgi:hypothetical protein
MTEKLYKFKFWDGTEGEAVAESEREALRFLGLGAYNVVAYEVTVHDAPTRPAMPRELLPALHAREIKTQLGIIRAAIDSLLYLSDEASAREKPRHVWGLLDAEDRADIAGLIGIAPPMGTDGRPETMGAPEISD